MLESSRMQSNQMLILSMNLLLELRKNFKASFEKFRLPAQHSKSDEEASPLLFPHYP